MIRPSFLKNIETINNKIWSWISCVVLLITKFLVLYTYFYANTSIQPNMFPTLNFWVPIRENKWQVLKLLESTQRD